MTSYFDSGVLIKLYVSESNSAQSAELASGIPQIPLLALHELEIRNAIRALLGRDIITAAQADLAVSAFQADIASRRLIQTRSSWADIYTRAEALSGEHTRELLCRALDILHVAAASILGCRRFVTADRRQQQLAVRSGLDVVFVNP